MAGVVLLIALTAGGARAALAQSGWARGNTAFTRGEYADAESLYARRARKGAPLALKVNQATARALGGDRETAARALEGLVDAEGRPGHEARYNLGTVLGEKRDYDAALARLREALVRDPHDEDARWNYEVVLRQKREEERRRQNRGQPPPQPSPQPSPSQSSSSPPPQSPPSGGSPQPSSGQSAQQGMTKQQAQQLLGALEELARADRQRQQKVRVLRDRHGKDW